MIIWFLLFLVIAELVTGLVVLFITLLFITIYISIKSDLSWLKLTLFLVTAGVPLLLFMYISGIVDQVYQPKPIDLKSLEKISLKGNPYHHDTTNKQIENGNYIYIYIQPDELRDAWNKRSQLDFDGQDYKQQQLQATLIRFLTSKGLRKDASGVESLTDDDVKAIENGIANVVYLKESNIRGRIYEIVWEFYVRKFNPNPSGHSVIQRFEFWKASVRIFTDHWLIGVGTGDVKDEFKSEYMKMQSLLEDKYQWRAHNQYLSVMVTFGIIGLVIFMFSWFYPPFHTKKFSDFYVFVILSIILISMLTEDTLENQAGATFAYFFYTFFLFGKKNHHPIIS